MSAGPIDLPKPIAEQEQAREMFLKGEGLRIDAYAGTGKTSTLQLLAGSSAQRGLYLAFNRSIAEDARARFPQQVACATSHSIAFRGIRRHFGLPEWKLMGTLTPNMIGASFTMPESHLPFRAVSAEAFLLLCPPRCGEALSAER